MTLSDEQLLHSVRESVAARSVPAGPGLDDVLRRGRRRTAARRGGVVGTLAALAVGAAVAVQLTGLPFVSSSPPAAPSVTLSPDPSRTTAMRPATQMYAIGDAAVVAAGLTPADGTVRWSVGTGSAVAAGVQPGAEDDIAASTTGDGFWLTTAHLTAPVDPGATSCGETTQDPMLCVREPQPDGTVLFELRLPDGELVQHLLLHRTGFVRVQATGSFPEEGATTDLPDPADSEKRLRALALDPTLRW